MSEMKLVPVEPTGAMVKAAMVYCHADRPGRASDIYRAMVEAAPVVSGGGLSDRLEHALTLAQGQQYAQFVLREDLSRALAIIRTATHQAATPDGSPDLRKALQRIAALTPGAANASTARDLHLTVKTIAEAALLPLPAAPEGV